MTNAWTRCSDKMPEDTVSMFSKKRGWWIVYHPDNGIWVESTQPSWWNKGDGSGDFDGPWITHWMDVEVDPIWSIISDWIEDMTRSRYSWKPVHWKDETFQVSDMAQKIRKVLFPFNSSPPYIDLKGIEPPEDNG